MITSYCQYFSASTPGKGYFGYTYPFLEDPDAENPKYPCPASATRSTDQDPDEKKRTWYCVWEKNVLGVRIPSTATADCAQIAEGGIGFKW